MIRISLHPSIMYLLRRFQLHLLKLWLLVNTIPRNPLPRMWRQMFQVQKPDIIEDTQTSVSANSQFRPMYWRKRKSCLCRTEETFTCPTGTLEETKFTMLHIISTLAPMLFMSVFLICQKWKMKIHDVTNLVCIWLLLDVRASGSEL